MKVTRLSIGLHVSFPIISSTGIEKILYVKCSNQSDLILSVNFFPIFKFECSETSQKRLLLVQEVGTG